MRSCRLADRVIRSRETGSAIEHGSPGIHRRLKAVPIPNLPQPRVFRNTLKIRGCLVKLVSSSDAASTRDKSEKALPMRIFAFCSPFEF